MTVDPHPAGPARFLGRHFEFMHDGKILVGVVESASFVGFTKRGNIPEHLAVMRGTSGRTITVSLVESRARAL